MKCSYSKQGDTYTGQNLLEITDTKLAGCSIFPNQPICKNDCFQCHNSKLFKGRPVYFEYSPDTLPDWSSGRKCKNLGVTPRCAGNMRPSVL